MPVYDTGAPVQVPVSPDCLGRLLNIFGEPLDDGPPLPQDNYRHIHGQPVSLSEAVGMSDVLETGIKVIDLLCPFVKGGKTGLFGGAGVGKTVEEIEQALQAGLLMFNVESLEELVRIDATAARLGVRAPVALRVNPAIDPMTHKYIATGLRESKFGIEAESVVESYRDALSMQHIEVVGVHAHIGSQITPTGPFREAMEKLSDIIRQVRELGAELRYIDIGGGLGITYHEEEQPAPQPFVAELHPFFTD